MSGFTGIPSNLLVPLFYARFDPSQAGVSGAVRRALVIGPSTSSAASSLSFVESVAQAAQTYGAGSPLTHMIAAFRMNEPFNELWAVNFPDAGSAVAATGSIAFTGTASAAGTHFFNIAGYDVPVAVASGDTATVQGAALAAAINAFLDQTAGAPLLLPVSATADTGTVTVTSRVEGTIGNSIPIMYNYRGAQGGEYAPAGTSVSITAMASGATDPSLTGLATLLGSNLFEWIITPWGTTTLLAPMTTLMNDVSGRWNYMQQLYGHVFAAARDSAANLLTLGGALNDPHITVLGVETGSPTPAYVWAAAAAGRALGRLRDEPGRTVQSLAIQGVLPSAAGGRFSLSTRNSLLTAGIATVNAGNDNTCRFDRLVTTYKTNAYSQTDPSMRDAETMYQSMAIVNRLKGVITTEYPDYRLADDGTPVNAGIAVVTPRVIRNRLILEYEAMQRLGWVENQAAFEEGLIVTRSQDDPSRVDVLFTPHYTSSLRIFAILNQFRLKAAA